MSYFNEGFKSLNSEKEGLVHNKLDDLSRGLQIDKARIGALKKKPFSRFRPGVQAELQSVAKGAIKKSKLAKNAINALINTNNEKLMKSEVRSGAVQNKLDDLKGKNNIRRFTREEIETLLDYLLNEGYVYNENSALKIVECMSEEWITDVLNEKYVRGVSKGKKKGKGSETHNSVESPRNREDGSFGIGYPSDRTRKKAAQNNARGGFR